MVQSFVVQEWSVFVGPVFSIVAVLDCAAPLDQADASDASGGQDGDDNADADADAGAEADADAAGGSSAPVQLVPGAVVAGRVFCALCPDKFFVKADDYLLHVKGKVRVCVWITCLCVRSCPCVWACLPMCGSACVWDCVWVGLCGYACAWVCRAKGEVCVWNHLPACV